MLRAAVHAKLAARRSQATLVLRPPYVHSAGFSTWRNGLSRRQIIQAARIQRLELLAHPQLLHHTLGSRGLCARPAEESKQGQREGDAASDDIAGLSLGSSDGRSRRTGQKKGGGAGPTTGMVAFGLFSTSAVLYALSDTFREKVDAGFDKVNESFEDFNDASREFFERLGEKVVPRRKEPWLLDLATMKYPENIPTLVIDLDKVILHLEHDSRQGWHVVKRPFADQFFKEMSHYYELVIFSDDVFPVALDIASKWNLPVTGVLHRDFCKKKRNHYVKDISKLGRRMDRVLILDHDPAAMQLQPENGVQIRSFEGDPSDSELMDLLEFLKAAATCNTDIRAFVRKYKEESEVEEVADMDIGRRYLIHKQAQDKVVESRRAVGRAFASRFPQQPGGGQAGFNQFPR
mmetsp:Transcript_74016/g.176178  ORF Transcript_74016/g.176178 Transcript_74016/m.176178 type:complete len:405 (+) Transcript_74016:53-1267(+)